MSINSAMLSGVSALIANSAALGAISDNISNVNTVGYKQNETQFEDLVTSKAVQGNYNSGGVQANVSQLVTQQGQFTQTSSATDLAINGNGFFVVASTPAGLSATSGPQLHPSRLLHARTAQATLVNSAGLYLQGWMANSSGVVTTDPSDLTKLSTINVNDVADRAERHHISQRQRQSRLQRPLRPRVTSPATWRRERRPRPSPTSSSSMTVRAGSTRCSSTT